ALAQAQAAQGIGQAIDLVIEVRVGEHADLAFLAFPAQGRPGFSRGADPLVEAIVDDVHLAAHTPACPGLAARQIDDLPVWGVELHIEVVQHGLLDPAYIGCSTALHRFQAVQTVAIEELLQTAALYYFELGPPHDRTAELKAVHQSPV